MQPNCPRCQGTVFYGWNYTVLSSSVVLVYCAGCGCVVGAVPAPQ